MGEMPKNTPNDIPSEKIILPRFMGLSLAASDFSRLIHPPSQETMALEKEGLIIFGGNYSSDQLETFIRQVCAWGNYPGIAARVLKNNSLSTIKKSFANAILELCGPKPILSNVIYELNQINGLGKPSFASKHLRFLRPELCPVFDSIIEKHSIYPYNEFGYEWFAKDCLEIASVLECLSIFNPKKRVGGKWYAADVELALYNLLLSQYEEKKTDY